MSAASGSYGVGSYVIAYVNKKLELLLDSVLEPIYQRVMAASIGFKVAILLVVGTIALAIGNQDVARRVYAETVGLVQVVNSGVGTIPLSQSIADQTRATANRLATTTKGDLLNLSGGYMTPWSTAQAAAATGTIDAEAIDRTAITSYIRAHAAPTCNCWTELPSESAHCVFISGWVMAAFAAMGVPASTGELQYALRSQHLDGSWSTFDFVDSDQYSSTYTTAWLLIGLLGQSTNGFVDEAHAPKVRSAVMRAAGWLLSHRLGGARWKAYPNMTTSAPSESVSGLALHALHLAVPSQMVEIDKEWLNALPDYGIPAEQGENFYVELLGGAGVRGIDHFVQLKVPWMLIATVDAFHDGNILERSEALYWIERTLSDKSVHSADADQNNWWRAELLYSLGYLLKQS
jgi:hypothetical protein